MFKFFRTYNKIILVVGGCVLMVAFLVPQAVQMFGPNPAKERIGTMHGQKVVRGQAQSAAQELSLLGSLPFGMGMMTDDEIAWLMIQADAKEMGLYASDREVDLALQAVGYDEELVRELASNRKTTVATIREIVRRWLIAEQYRQTVMGTAYRDVEGGSPSLAINRIEIFQTIIQRELATIPPQFHDMAYREIAPVANAFANGTRRISTPLLARYIQNNFANVTGRVALIQPDVEAAAEPDEATLNEVFDTYKNSLPGAGEPFPFGYMYPDRVKLSYLQVPMGEVRDQVDVDYLEVLDAYKANPQRFADEMGNTPGTPTAEAVAALTAELADRRAQQLGAKIMATVQSLIAENQRGLPQSDGYLKLTDDYQPLAWDTIIEAVQDQHGVTLRAMGNPDEWVAVTDLGDLPDIGFSMIGEGQNGVPFANYVAATWQLADDPSQVLRSLRTQVGVASKPLRGFDGNLYVFRLSAAETAHAPESIDEVRERVVADAKQIAAYEKLITETDLWRTKTIAEGLDAAAAAGDTIVQDLPPFQKVAGTEGDPPSIPGVGASRPFVDAAFDLVVALDDPQADIAALPLEQRIAVVPVPNAQVGPALAVYVLDEFAPLTRAGYEQELARGASISVDTALDDLDSPNPLSTEAIAERVGFDLEAYRDDS